MKKLFSVMALVIWLSFTPAGMAQDQVDSDAAARIAAAQKALDNKAAAHANDAPGLLKENEKLRDQVTLLTAQVAELKAKLATDEQLLAKASEAAQEKAGPEAAAQQAVPLVEPILTPNDYPSHPVPTLLSYPVRPGNTGFLHGLVVVLDVVDKTSFIGSTGVYEARGDVKTKFLFTGVDTSGLTTSGGGGGCLVGIPSKLRAVETVTEGGETYYKLEPAQPEAHHRK